MTDELVERVRQFTVGVRRRGPGGGAGVVWRSDGLIVTNAHVARGSGIVVELPGGREARGEVVAHDPRRDLAAVKIDATRLIRAPIGDSGALRTGELVVAVGNPLGVKGAASLGIVHQGGTDDWVRADVRLAPGNSGGPLVNARGEVVGINAMIVNGLGLAVPSRAVTRFLDAATRPLFGVTLQPAGVMGGLALAVLDVTAGSLASRAGFMLGDVLLGINGARFRGISELPDAMAGGPFTIDYLRAGVRRSAAVDPREARRAA